jgi:hypothetical protein
MRGPRGVLTYVARDLTKKNNSSTFRTGNTKRKEKGMRGIKEYGGRRGSRGALRWVTRHQKKCKKAYICQTYRVGEEGRASEQRRKGGGGKRVPERTKEGEKECKGVGWRRGKEEGPP